MFVKGTETVWSGGALKCVTYDEGMIAEKGEVMDEVMAGEMDEVMDEVMDGGMNRVMDEEMDEEMDAETTHAAGSQVVQELVKMKHAAEGMQMDETKDDFHLLVLLKIFESPYQMPTWILIFYYRDDCLCNFHGLRNLVWAFPDKKQGHGLVQQKD